MKKIAVVYHSGYGHTEVQAKHILKGTEGVDGIEAKLFKAEDVTETPEKLNDYDGIIFGSPTYLGSVSASFKAFMEASSKLWGERKWLNKIAAGFTNSHSHSGDKLNSIMQLAVFAAQHGMIWVGVSDLNESPDDNMGDPEAVNRLGSWLGLMAQSDNASPEVTPPSGDLKTAELLGKRVAEITLRMQ